MILPEYTLTGFRGKRAEVNGENAPRGQEPSGAAATSCPRKQHTLVGEGGVIRRDEAAGRTDYGRQAIAAYDSRVKDG